MLLKNSRQAYGVNRRWATSTAPVVGNWPRRRACAARVSGGGTNKSGSGAFADMCKGGRMFAPTKIYRRWHRKINLHQKRYAVCSALAASSLPSLLLARRRKIENVAEVPLVVDEPVQGYAKTKQAVAFLEHIKADDDLNRVNSARQVRAGHGKTHNRCARRGPMLVLPDDKGVQAFRNIFGLDVADVNALNLLHLAPGRHRRSPNWLSLVSYVLLSLAAVGAISCLARKLHRNWPK
ncbi:MAG UNVERIFIED_CONTAM: 50S ribosomal protein L4 [Planctomycetaceae bacterium]